MATTNHKPHNYNNNSSDDDETDDETDAKDDEHIEMPPYRPGTSDVQPDDDPGAASTAPPFVSDPSNTESLDSSSNPLPSMPTSLIPLLKCPVCNYRLSAPVTLHCGHSICTHHLALTCPVLNCIPISTTQTPPNIPSSSNVAYYPAPQQHPARSSPQPLSSAVDVTISKIISLVDRIQTDLDRLNDAAPVFRDDANSSDDDSDIPGSRVPATRPRTASISSAERPRKRRRRQLTHDDDANDGGDGEQGGSDLLSHLRTQSTLQRATHHDQPLLPPHPPSAATRETILAQFDKDLLTELTCEICFALIYQPLTTPCQHTFCTKCLHRSLDHNSSCPLCRQDLPSFLYFQEHPHNKVILSLILEAFPTLYQEHGEAIQAEERDARLDIPIFVCQLSFPGMPTLLHFFEPRYRLMLRRCLESPRPCFGMIMPPKPGSVSQRAEYGTMLEIKSVQVQADGRSLVETWGAYRFRILESGMLDGYMVGRIERIDDYPEDLMEDPIPVPESSPSTSTSTPSSSSSPVVVSASSSSVSRTSLSHRTSPIPSRSSPHVAVVQPRHPSNAALMARCQTFLTELERGTAPWIVQRLSNTYGRPPQDPSSYSYWVTSILPIDDHEKAKLLPIRSPRLRLLLVVHWIEQLNNNWYTPFSSFMRLVKHASLLIGCLFFFFAWFPGASRAAAVAAHFMGN